MEEWRDILGFEGIYQVSNYGRVRGVDRYVNSGYGSKRKVKSKILKLRVDKYGYETVHLVNHGINKMKTVHRAARAIAANPGKICLCCKGSRNTAYGYKWEYKIGG